MKALLLIDIQKGLTKRDIHNKEQFINTVNSSIEKFRANSDLVIFVRHENKQLVPCRSDWEIDNNILVELSDKIFSKHKGDAFSNSELVDFLNGNSITDITIGGLVTHGCVSYTCKGGHERGFNIALLKNAHSLWNKDAEDKIEATEISLGKLGINTIDLSMI